MEKTNAVLDVITEREKQKEKYNGDSSYCCNELPAAAVSYIDHAIGRSWIFNNDPDNYQGEEVPGSWPWNNDSWKPKSPRQDLVRAAALIIAEIERIDQSCEFTPEPDLQQWFGLSYSSFAVLPRVFMEAMPQEWQDKMAALLHQYDETIDTTYGDIKSCEVVVKDENNRYMKMPEEILNYRHPDRQFIARIMKQ